MQSDESNTIDQKIIEHYMLSGDIGIIYLCLFILVYILIFILNNLVFTIYNKLLHKEPQNRTENIILNANPNKFNRVH